VASPVSFVVNKGTDGTYTFAITQTDAAANTSAAQTLIWVRDTVVPGVPTITSPSTSPYTAPGNLAITGNCELNSTVSLTGSDTQGPYNCAGDGTYNFNVVKSTDATYTFSVTQTDRAGNTSSGANLTWIRDSSGVTAPIVSNPATNPYKSNASSVSISGTCTAGYTVTLAGVTSGEVASPAGSLTQTCTGGGTFGYVVNKSVDGTYALSFTQTFNSVTSSASSFTWDRNTVLPIVTYSATPPASNTVNSASIAFSADKVGSIFQCKTSYTGVPGSYASCTSPVNLTALVNDPSYTFYVIATDPYGNISNAATASWNQEAYNTMALYHLNNGPATTDVSHWVNTLTGVGSPAETSSGCKFSGCVTLGNSKYYSAADSASLDLGSSTMTIEGWYKLSTVPATGNYYTLVSKTGVSPNIGWELQLLKSSSTKCRFVFVASANGSTTATVNSNTAGTSTLCSTSSWIYFAVKINAGKVSFYSGISTISSRGTNLQLTGMTTLPANANLLKIGANQTSATTGTSRWFLGLIDEVRLSNILRTVTPGAAVPSAAWTSD